MSPDTVKVKWVQTLGCPPAHKQAIPGTERGVTAYLHIQRKHTASLAFIWSRDSDHMTTESVIFTRQATPICKLRWRIFDLLAAKLSTISAAPG